MAKFVILEPYVTVNGVDLSDHVREAAVEMTVADVDVTASGGDGIERLGGLRDDKFTLTLYQDFATGEVDKTFWTLFDAATIFEVRVAAQGAVISDANPAWTGDVLITEYPPTGGEIGTAAMTEVVLPVSGRIARETS